MSRIAICIAAALLLLGLSSAPAGALPIIDVSPESLSSLLAAGESEQRQIEIDNGGDADLSWEASVLHGDGDPDTQPVANFIGIYADSSAAVCDGELSDPGEVTLWVVAHVPAFETGVAALEFSVANLPANGPAGFTTFDWRSVLLIGDPSSGISMAFTSPLVPDDDGNAVLGSITCTALAPGWMGEGREIGVEPGSGGLIAVGTDFVEVAVHGSYFTFNCAAACECYLPAADPPSWLALSPSSGTVAPGGSATLTVGFDAEGVAAGDHAATVSIASNDPQTPIGQVAALLHVSGVPDIELSGGPFQFGHVALGTTSEHPLLVANAGAEPLSVLSFSADQPEFGAVPSSFIVAPGGEQLVQIGFTPILDGVGVIAAMYLSSNDPAQPLINIAMSGMGFDPDDPRIVVAPDSLVANLAVGEAESLVLTIANLGAANLDWQIEAPWGRIASGVGGRSEDLDYIGIFADAAGELCAADALAYSNARVYLIAHVPGVAEGIRAASFRIAGFPEHESGGLISYEWSSDIELLNFDQADGLSVDLAFLAAQVPDANGNVLLGRIEFFSTEEAWLGADHVLAVRPRVDTEQLGIVSADFTEIDLPGSHFTFNCSSLCSCYLPGGGPHDWYSFSPPSGTLPPGEETAVAVTFDAAQLVGGVYTADVVVASDDPDLPRSPVALLLGVRGAPDIQLSAAAFDFGRVLLGQSARLTLVIANVGTDLLSIPFVGSDADEFVATPTGLQIPAGESASVALTFAPVSIGQASEELILASNDPDEGSLALPLSGSGYLHTDPSISVAPQSIYARLPVGGTRTALLTVGNSGGLSLVWAIAQAEQSEAKRAIPGWISIDPAAGTTAPGEESVLTILLDAAGLSVGEYLADLVVTSNDPERPELTVELGIYVGDEPAIAANPDEFLLRFDRGQTVQRDLILSNPGFAELSWQLTLASEADRAADRVPADYVGLFASQYGTVCAQDVFYENHSYVYVRAHVPNFESGIRAVHFRLANLPIPPDPWNMHIAWYGDLQIGDPRSDFAIAWAEPALPDASGNVLLGVISFWTGDAYWIDRPHVIGVEAPASQGGILLVDEANRENFVDGSHFTFNCETDCDCFIPQAEHWLSVDGRGGVLTPGAESSVLLAIDTTQLPYGEYIDELLIATNDPVQPLLTIPVRLSVSPPTPALLSRFDVEAEPGIVKLRWELSAAGGEQRLEARGAGGARVLAFVEETPGSFTAIDTAAALAQGGEFRYSLYFGSGDEWRVLAERVVVVEAPVHATALLAPHPNPFNPHTTIPFSLAEAQRVRIAVFDVSGRRIALLADESYPAGAHETVWLGRDDAGERAATGVYFARMETRGGALTRKLVLLR